MTDAALDKELAALEAQKAAIDAQIKAKKSAARDGAVAQARKLVREFDLTPSMVFGSGGAAKSGKAPKIFAYADGKGNKWTGGRGRVPDWVKAVKAKGESIEKYRVA